MVTGILSIFTVFLNPVRFEGVAVTVSVPEWYWRLRADYLLRVTSEVGADIPSKDVETVTQKYKIHEKGSRYLQRP